MTRRIDLAEAPEAARADFGRYQTECATFDITASSWGAWWARYGADYTDPAPILFDGDPWVPEQRWTGLCATPSPRGYMCTLPVDHADAHIAHGHDEQVIDTWPQIAAASAAFGEVGLADAAVLIVSEGAQGSATSLRPPARPAGQRSLRNDIAHLMYEDLAGNCGPIRQWFEAAQVAIDAATNWVLVFGPQALIDEVSR